MKTSVKSKIPHGKSTKTTGLPVPTRLPHPKSRLKSNTNLRNKQTKSPILAAAETNNNLQANSEENLNNIAFICSPKPTEHCDQNGNGDILLTEIVSPQPATPDKSFVDGNRLEFDENCEVLSVSSAGPSPIKLLDTEDLISYNSVDNLDNSNSSLIDNFESLSLEGDFRSDWSKPVIDNFAPDLVAFRRFQEVLNPSSASGRSSPCSEKETIPSKGRLPLPSSTVPKTNSLLRPSKKFPTQKPTTAKSNLKPKATSKLRSKSEAKSFGKQNKVTLPGKELHISPSNAMDYVRKITGAPVNSPEVSQAPRRRSRAVNETHITAMHRYNGKVDLSDKSNRKISSGSGATRNNGKWSADIDSAMNVPRRNSKTLQISCDDANASSGTSARADRKKQYQESRIKTDAPSENRLSKSTPSTASKVGCKSPKIVRPVVRPPKSLLGSDTNQTTDTDEKPAVNVGLDEDESDSENEEKLDNFLAEKSDDDLWSGRVRIRRSSVPASTISDTRSRPRRRASEHFSKRLLPGYSEESGYSTNTASSSYTEGDHAGGDSVKHDIVRMQERLKQNERYREILQNPEIVTFGQWRVKKEGNYAPEEMYGVTERQRIRSSSGSVSPVRRMKTPEKDSGDRHTVEQNTESAKHKPDNHANEVEELNMSSIDQNLPSLNSTALMADYSFESDVFTPEKSKSETKDHSSHHKNILTPNQHRAVNKLLKGGLNGMVDQYLSSSDVEGSGSLPSSPLHGKGKITDVTAASNDKLAEKMDEMLEEYKIVRGALEQLHKALDAEESQKKRLETENENLIKKMDELHKENMNLKKLVDLQKATYAPKNDQSQSRGLNLSGSNHNISTQTDADKQPTWYKSELSSVGSDLECAVGQLHRMRDLKEEFAQKINDAEQKLHVLMSTVKGNK